MGKKGLTSIFSKLVDSPAATADTTSPPWPWPSCRNPETASFREDDRPCCTTARGPTLRTAGGEMYKTVNSVYFDCSADDASCFDDGEEEVEAEHGVLDDDDGFSTTTASEEWSEAVIRSLGRTSTTDRFFFDPAPASNSILASPPPPPPPPGKPAASSEEKPPEPSTSLVEESVAVAVDSEDPYGDFRASMEEMVAAHRLRGWAALEELLLWYLRINGKHNHALIVAAFVDLLVGLASSSSSAAATTTTTTTVSSSSSSSASTATTTTTTTSSTCGDDVTARTATMEQCGGASCSPASSDEITEAAS